MSTTPTKVPLLRVLLRNLLVHGIASILIVHIPPFIHSCITSSFEVQIQNIWLHSDPQTEGYERHYKVFLEHQYPEEPLGKETNTSCPSARTSPKCIASSVGVLWQQWCDSYGG